MGSVKNIKIYASCMLAYIKPLLFVVLHPPAIDEVGISYSSQKSGFINTALMHYSMHACSTNRGVLTGLCPHCYNSTFSVVFESDIGPGTCSSQLYHRAIS